MFMGSGFFNGGKQHRISRITRELKLLYFSFSFLVIRVSQSWQGADKLFPFSPPSAVQKKHQFFIHFLWENGASGETEKLVFIYGGGEKGGGEDDYAPKIAPGFLFRLVSTFGAFFASPLLLKLDNCSLKATFSLTKKKNSKTKKVYI